MRIVLALLMVWIRASFRGLLAKRWSRLLLSAAFEVQLPSQSAEDLGLPGSR